MIKALSGAFFILRVVVNPAFPMRLHYNCEVPMVRDGYYYALPLLAVGLFIGRIGGVAWAVLPFLLAAFFLWFFRDPERAIPNQPDAVVSPADGKVTDISPLTVNGVRRTRISIFLNVFNVHVNRSPIAGVIRNVSYKKGQYLNAMNPASAELNEQNLVAVEGNGQVVEFKQIAGLLARRIVFNKKIGDQVERGERIGLIKFGSRVDVMLDASASLQIKVGDHVKGGSTILAYMAAYAQLAATAAEHAGQGVR